MLGAESEREADSAQRKIHIRKLNEVTEVETRIGIGRSYLYPFVVSFIGLDLEKILARAKKLSGRIFIH